MRGSVFILEDNPERIALMGPVLEEILPQYDHQFCGNAPETLVWFKENLGRVALISLDHDLESVVPAKLQPFDPGCGHDVVEYLVAAQPVCPVIVHTSNANAEWTMVYRLRQVGWFTTRVYPRDHMDWIKTDWADDIRKLAQSGWIFDLPIS